MGGEAHKDRQEEPFSTEWTTGATLINSVSQLCLIVPANWPASYSLGCTWHDSCRSTFETLNSIQTVTRVKAEQVLTLRLERDVSRRCRVRIG